MAGPTEAPQGPEPVAELPDAGEGNIKDIMNRSSLRRRRVVVAVGGGIAAYKACELVRELQRSGAEVRVAMTEAAQSFVTALTFQSLSGHPVLTHAYDPAQEASFGHIDLARWAELIVVAPATADLIARIRAGMANDAVTTSLLAYDGPVLLAPAMNTVMFENAQTQENLQALLAQPRFQTVGPDSGLLACGEVGAGRLANVELITDAAAQVFRQGPLSGQKVLITAGPTREAIDPVRFLSNPSTGKMGIELAHAARSRGADVTVVLGPVGQPLDRDGLDIVDVVSAEDMASAVFARVDAADFFVAAAAVSDYRPRTAAPQKVKKLPGDENLELVRTPDILLETSNRVRALPRRPVLVGFAAETEKVLEHAREKLDRKALDFIVANQVGVTGSGFASDSNHVFCLGRDGSSLEKSGTKAQVAAWLWDRFLAAPRANGRG